MPRYIDAEKLKLSIIGLREDAIRNKQEVQVWALNACEFMVETADTADVEEVRHGEWVRDADLVDGDVWVRWSCSKCGYVRTRGWENTNAGAKPRAKLCENCGAKMDGKEKNDD